MSLITPIMLALRAMPQLGPAQVGLNALYQFGIRTGRYQRELTRALTSLEAIDRKVHPLVQPCLGELPDRRTVIHLLGHAANQVIREADEIVHGYVRLFGSHPVPLELTPPKPLGYWTKYARGDKYVNNRDIKFTWEAGRFGWACKLAMAYHLSKNERYAESFWQYAETFLASNPPYQGPHWASAQEAAIRLIALAFTSQVFTQSRFSYLERQQAITKAIAVHAERIPPTLIYARSQNNNHLVTEALGLYTAAALLPDHPRAPQWYALGWNWLKQAFLTQISDDGTYVQHSTNYHRLMLQCALWAFAVHEHSFKDEEIPANVLKRLEAATRWLWKLVDPETGRTPNLGHNDGAYILPLTVCQYHDYRPVVYAAARAFLHTKIVPSGPWEDMGLWLPQATGQDLEEAALDRWHSTPVQAKSALEAPYILVNHKNKSWITIHAATYKSRPAHADQLHIDLWWRGLNIAQDPGTYLYNAPPVWENSLADAFVHNLVTLDDHEFMKRASRFLYLDWAQARTLASRPSPKGAWESLTVEHNGYRKLKVSHSRMVNALPDGRWEIHDLLEGIAGEIHSARMHWLLPNWEYEFQPPSGESATRAFKIRIKSPHGWIELVMNSPSAQWKDQPEGIKFQIARAGEILYGSGSVGPTTGWTSPTYGDKIPALACIFEVTQALPIDLKSEWILPVEL